MAGQGEVYAVLGKELLSVIEDGRRVEAAEGFSVGQIVRILAEPVEVVVAKVTTGTVFVEWPWYSIDPESAYHWDGTMGFPCNPHDMDWRGTPWRMEPDGWELSAGCVCMIGVPGTLARIAIIEHYESAADFGWLPRPQWVLGLRPLEFEDDPEAGFDLYLHDPEPIEIEPVEGGDDWPFAQK